MWLRGCLRLSWAALALLAAAGLSLAVSRLLASRALPLRAAWQQHAARVAAAAVAAAGAPAPAACGVALVRPPPPPLDVTPGNCSRASAYLANPENYLPYFHYLAFNRYRLAKYLSRDVSAQPVVRKEEAALLLFDSTAWDDAYFCLSMHRSLNVNGTADWENILPQFMAARAAAIAAALAALRPGQRLAVTHALPLESWHRVDVAHPAQVRLVLDLDYVPPSERALGAARYVVAPYVIHEVVPAPPPPLPPAARARLLFLHASCADADSSSPGMRFRSALIRALVALSDARADARCLFWGDSTISEEDYRARMRNATFCPLLPGDLPSTSRVAEVIANACVPVFVGPPWTLLPLLETAQLPWAEAALFVEMTDVRNWTTPDDIAAKDWQPDPPGVALRARLDAAGALLRAADAAHLVRVLAAVPPERAAAMLDAARPMRRAFAVKDDPARSNGRHILDAVCRYATNASLPSPATGGPASFGSPAL